MFINLCLKLGKLFQGKFYQLMMIKYLMINVNKLLLVFSVFIFSVLYVLFVWDDK